MSRHVSDLASRLARLSTVEFDSDGHVSTPAQDPRRVQAAMDEARANLDSRELDVVERYYFACALRHQAHSERDREAERDLELEAFSWFKTVFLDPDLPDAYPVVRTRTLDELKRPEVADVLLEMLAGPHPPMEDQVFADHLATYLWTVDDRYWPSMFGYALSLDEQVDLAIRAGLFCDLIRRATNDGEFRDHPPSAPVIWAAQSLKGLAKQAKRSGDAALAAEYAAAVDEMRVDGNWRQAIESPAVVSLAKRAVQEVSVASAS